MGVIGAVEVRVDEDLPVRSLLASGGFDIHRYDLFEDLGEPFGVVHTPHRPTSIALGARVHMDAEFTCRVGEHHNRLGREGVFDAPDRLAVDFVFPVRHHLTLD